MNDRERELRARRSTYELLARLYLEEPDARIVRSLRELPGFAEHLAAPAAREALLEEPAAEYQRLFGLNVYPYESIFVDPEVMLNTAASGRIAELYRGCGFDPSGARTGAPDHLGLELRFMGALIAAEERAFIAGDHAARARARGWQARCLREHLACWVPLYTLALARVAIQPLYRLLATLTCDLVLGDLASLRSAGEGESQRRDIPPGAQGRFRPSGLAPATREEDELDEEGPTGFRPSSLPEGEPAADADEPGINAVIRSLLAPARVGIFLSRADVIRLARDLDLPVAMGDRFQMVRGLFTSAAQYEQLPLLLDSLDELFIQAEERLATLVAGFPAWAEYGREWQARIVGGRGRLAELKAESSAVLAGVP